MASERSLRAHFDSIGNCVSDLIRKIHKSVYDLLRYVRYGKFTLLAFYLTALRHSTTIHITIKLLIILPGFTLKTVIATQSMEVTSKTVPLLTSDN